MQQNNTVIKKVKTPKKEIGLLTLLANVKSKRSQDLLKKYGKPEAKGYEDLELKLAELYRDSDDKIALEKELAEMHPHKSFILRNLTPAPIVIEDKISSATGKEAGQSIRDFVLDEKSNCSGNPNCNCQMSNACGCSSSFTGPSNSGGAQIQVQPFGKNLIDWVGPTMMIFTIGMLSYLIIKTSERSK